MLFCEVMDFFYAIYHVTCLKIFSIKKKIYYEINKKFFCCIFTFSEIFNCKNQNFYHLQQFCVMNKKSSNYKKFFYYWETNNDNQFLE